MTHAAPEVDGILLAVDGVNPTPRLSHCASCHRPIGDPLTGLPDRTAWYQTASNVIAGTPRSVLLICDIDRFKTVNDTFGHGAGDTVLRAVACALSAFVREGDYVYRYSGDEFVIVLCDVDNKVALRMIEQLRKFIAKLCIPVVALDGHVHVVSGLSISVGWAVEPDPNCAPCDLILAADSVLLAAKRRSRKEVAPIRQVAWRSGEVGCLSPGG